MRNVGAILPPPGPASIASSMHGHPRAAAGLGAIEWHLRAVLPRRSMYPARTAFRGLLAPGLLARGRGRVAEGGHDVMTEPRSSLFDDAAIPAETHAVNAAITELPRTCRTGGTSGLPRCATARRQRRGPFPAPSRNPRAHVRSRSTGRRGKIHAPGDRAERARRRLPAFPRWRLGARRERPAGPPARAHRRCDRAHGGERRYRLAPEHPFPPVPTIAKRRRVGDRPRARARRRARSAVGGESAGGHLSRADAAPHPTTGSAACRFGPLTSSSAASTSR